MARFGIRLVLAFIVASTALAVVGIDEETPQSPSQPQSASKAQSVSQTQFTPDIETRIVKLNHASAAEVAEKLNMMWNGEFGQVWRVTKMAVAYPESNSIMITAPKTILDACEKALAALDVEAQQVYIEARFVELGNTASHKVGIDWSMFDGMRGTATLGGGVNSRRVGDAVSSFTTRNGANEYNYTEYSVGGRDADGNAKSSGGRNGSITYFNGTLNFSEMSLTLSALDKTEDAKTFSNPKIIVSSGKKATVDMTTKYPNVKVAAKRTEASGSTSLDIASNLEAIPGEDKFMFANEAFFSWGISLDVTPRVGTNGLINVSIVPTISSTAVIGGLSVTEERQVDSGIPLLRSIPWIGPRIFGGMERVKEQKEIIVFVTVGLVDPHEIREDAGLPKNAVLGRQYTKGQKLEPGDRPERSMEGMESLDMRLLEEQAKDPLQTKKRGANFNFGDYMPFTKDENYKERSDD